MFGFVRLPACGRDQYININHIQLFESRPDRPDETMLFLACGGAERHLLVVPMPIEAVHARLAKLSDNPAVGAAVLTINGESTVKGL
jgi:hypothetical protein